MDDNQAHGDVYEARSETGFQPAANQPAIVSNFIHLLPNQQQFSQQPQSILANISANQIPSTTCITRCKFKGDQQINTTTTTDHSVNQQQQLQVEPILLLDSRQQQQRTRQSSRGPIETLLGTFIGGGGHHHQPGKANCRSTCLLGAALVASILNIILLSFVVKTIQLNDKGFIDGKISWDEQMESTILRLSTKLSDKSISLKLIESAGDAPLKVETTSSCSGRLSSINEKGDHAQSQHDIIRYPILLSTRRQAGSTGTITTRLALATSQQTKFNYTAVNVLEGVKSTPTAAGAELEIETDLLVWDLINRSGFSTNQTRADFLALSPPVVDPVMDTTTNSDKELNVKEEVVSSKTTRSSRRLLEFDKELELISLPLEDRINLESTISTSVIVNGVLDSPEITGSLEENLESMEALKLVSKSAVARLSALEDLILSAPMITLSAGKNLYLPEGIPYFDMEPPSSSNMDKTQSAVKGANSQQQAASLLLRAYNLKSVNGVLMATSAI